MERVVAAGCKYMHVLALLLRSVLRRQLSGAHAASGLLLHMKAASCWHGDRGCLCLQGWCTLTNIDRFKYLMQKVRRRHGRGVAAMAVQLSTFKVRMIARVHELM